MGDKNRTFNVHNGGQVGMVIGDGKVNATQINGVNASELDSIIKDIMENLSALKDEDAKSIEGAVDMARKELAKPETKVSSLRSCVSQLESMLTIANGIPVLSNNLHGLINYIETFIH